MPLVYKTHKNEASTVEVFIDYYGNRVEIAPGETKSFVVDNVGTGGGDYDDAELRGRVGALEAGQSLRRLASWSGTVNPGQTVVTAIADVPSLVLAYNVSTYSLMILGIRGVGSVYEAGGDSGYEGQFRVIKDNPSTFNLYIANGCLVLQNNGATALAVSVAQYVNP